MFGRNNEEEQEQGGEAIPPPRTLMIRELVTRRDGKEAWEDIAYQGHNIQTTEAGGINILRLAIKRGIGPKGEDMIVQQMVVGLPAGRWQRIYEDIDLTQSSPFAIN